MRHTSERALRLGRRQLVVSGVGLVGLALLQGSTVFAASTDGVCEPQRTQGLIGGSRGEAQLVRIEGPGVFVSAAVGKQGGALGATFVNLDLDGRNVISTSYGAVRNYGLTQQNPY